MKKLIISIIIILLCVLIYFLIFQGINVAGLNINSISGLKKSSENFNSKILQTTTQTTQIYPMKEQELEKNIKNLETSKENYTNKVKYAKEDTSIGVTQIEKYKIEYLWTIIGNYAREQNLNLTLDIASTEEVNENDVYNLNFTIVGSYIGTTDFIYNIENDNSFSFSISNIKILPYIIETDKTTGAITEVDPSTININQVELLNITRTDNKYTTITENVKTTFTINNVGINFK